MPEAVPVGDGYFYSLPGGHYTIDGCRRAVAIDRPGWQPLDWVVAAGEIGANAPPGRIRTGSACSATNALQPASPLSSGIGAIGVRRGRRRLFKQWFASASALRADFSIVAVGTARQKR